MKATVDLRPEETLVREIIWRSVLRWSRIAAPVFLGVLVMGVALHVKASFMARQNEVLKAEMTDLRGQARDLAPLASKLREVSTNLGALQTLLNEPDWPTLLSDIAAAAAGHVRLKGLSITRDESAESPLRSIAISGFARANTHVVSFMDRLAGCPHLARLELEVSRVAQRGETAGEIEFQIRGVVLEEGVRGDV